MSRRLDEWEPANQVKDVPLAIGSSVSLAQRYVQFVDDQASVLQCVDEMGFGSRLHASLEWLGSRLRPSESR